MRDYASSRLYITLEALRTLGPVQLGLYAWYRLGLRSGYLRWRTPVTRDSGADRRATLRTDLLTLPRREDLIVPLGEAGIARLLSEADEIVAGQVRLFGGEPVPLQLTPPAPLAHWTVWEMGGGKEDAVSDIKFVWEAGRFGWAYTLGRAYHLSGDERYASAFWQFAETFLDANPHNLGPHWASAQEVALRLIAFVFAAQVFAPSAHTTPQRLTRLGEAISAHAARIPLTLAYARAQNNNHLLSEAAGLYTAGLALPTHPAAAGWRASGWRWFDRALRTQIADDGSYVQHSANYHRLMLQLALWVNRLSPLTDHQSSLASATHWLLTLLDPDSGRVPNLGPNDGAYILPLAVCPFHDYRPALQASAMAFLGAPVLESGRWDEMALWLTHRKQTAGSRTTGGPRRIAPDRSPVLRLSSSDSWAYLRVAHFTSRPGHADQLHLDLWWRGSNVAQDAGTYLYNAPPPWDNSLARTAVHNTITINALDQMRRAGRFLWLDWAQGKLISHEKDEDGRLSKVIAQHDGYRRLGVIHRRMVTACEENRWLVEDHLMPARTPARNQPAARVIRLHWLLADWPWEIAENEETSVTLRLRSPHGWVSLQISTYSPTLASPLAVQIVRAGQLLSGSGAASPTQGWASPTYGSKVPGLSFAIEVSNPLPLTLVSEWRLSDPESRSTDASSRS